MDKSYKLILAIHAETVEDIQNVIDDLRQDLRRHYVSESRIAPVHEHTDYKWKSIDLQFEEVEGPVEEIFVMEASNLDEEEISVS